jgi:hypothetical protein
VKKNIEMFEKKPRENLQLDRKNLIFKKMSPKENLLLKDDLLKKKMTAQEKLKLPIIPTKEIETPGKMKERKHQEKVLKLGNSPAGKTKLKSKTGKIKSKQIEKFKLFFEGASPLNKVRPSNSNINISVAQDRTQIVPTNRKRDETADLILDMVPGLGLDGLAREEKSRTNRKRDDRLGSPAGNWNWQL